MVPMDNLTHSLAGALIGEATSDFTSEPRRTTRRSLVMVASIVANNFPDIDGVYTRIMPAPLGYLLHHRGHTHTLLGLIPQFILIFAFLYLFKSFRAELRDRTSQKLTVFVVVVGLLMHMLLDSWNSYGVHPFYPFSGSWLYGDLIFIIEPFIWFSFAIPLFFTLAKWWTRWPILILISVVPVVAAFNNLLTWYAVAASFSYALILAFLTQRAKTPTKKVLFGIIGGALFIGIQAFSASKVRTQLHAEFQPQSPEHKILELVLNPLPANPFCWSVIQIEADSQNNKYMTEGKVRSSWPSVLPPESCLTFRPAPQRTETPLTAIKGMVETDCWVDAWMRFARAPFFGPNEVYDLRFNREGMDNFTRMEVAQGTRECPRFIPPWSRPRQDLLDEADKVK